MQHDPSTPEIATQWHRFEELSADQLYELLRFRQDIFVVEQRSPYPDLDGLDQNAWHLAARAESEVAGYLRLVPPAGSPPLVRIGRVAVLPRLRGRGLGRMLMRHALQLHREQYGAQDVVLSAQAHLAPFYQAFGFVETGGPYDEFGVRHVDMRLQRCC